MKEITVNSEADTDLNVLRSSKKPQEAPGADLFSDREEQRRLLGGKVPSCFPIHLVLCVNSVQTWGEEFHPFN